jgi:hypothetical protein
VKLYNSIFLTEKDLNISFKNISFVDSAKNFSFSFLLSISFTSFNDQYFKILTILSESILESLNISISFIHPIFISFHNNIVLYHALYISDIKSFTHSIFEVFCKIIIFGVLYN